MKRKLYFPTVLERLSELEHNQWRLWSRTLSAREKLSFKRIRRWEKCWVDYSLLPDSMKEHDRKWARQSLKIVIPVIICSLEIRREQIIRHREKCEIWRKHTIYNANCVECMVGSISGVIDPMIAELKHMMEK